MDELVRVAAALRRALGVFLLFSVLGLTACPAPTPVDAGTPTNDSGTPEQDAGTPTPDAGTLAERCHERWQTLCVAWSTCGDSAPSFPSFFTSVEDCVERGARSCEATLAAAANASGLTAESTSSPTRFRSCTAAMAAREVCDRVQTYVFRQNYSLDAECRAATGQLTDGTSCFLPDQCQSSYCQMRGGCGVCARRANVGGTCAGAQDCELGLGCFGGTCQTYLEAGGNCSGVDQCRPGFACASGRCAAKLDAGATCDPVAPLTCRSNFCKDRRCTDYPVDGTPGGPCGVDVATGLPHTCAAGAVCKFFTPAYQGLCVARVKAGDRCFFTESFQGDPCEPFSRCVNGVCTAPGPEPTCGQAGGPTPARRDGGVLPPVDGGSALAASIAAQNTLTCDALFACPRYQAITESLVGPRSNCEGTLALIAARFETNPFRATSATQVDACNTALAALSPCELADATLGGVPAPAGCVQLPGLTPAGVACEAGYQCGVNGHCTVGLLDQSCGICATTGGDGGTCAVNDDCGAGLACTNGRCVTAAVLAGACSAAQPCDRGLVCRLGFCAQRGDTDAGCNPNGDECATGLFCHRTQRTCVEPLIVGRPDGGALAADGGIAGASCGVQGGALVDCPYGFACKLTNATTSMGQCDVARAPGETCDWSGGLSGRGQCTFPSRCINGVCSLGDATFCQ